MIPPGEIARLAHRLSLGDKTIEKDYVLTWVLREDNADVPRQLPLPEVRFTFKT